MHFIVTIHKSYVQYTHTTIYFLTSSFKIITKKEQKPRYALNRFSVLFCIISFLIIMVLYCNFVPLYFYFVSSFWGYVNPRIAIRLRSASNSVFPSAYC